MFRSVVGATLAAAALALGGANPAGGEGAPLPGPKQPTEHAAISGGFFQVKSGKPGCFTGAGTLGAPFPVPRGAVVTGATVYVIDGQTSANLFVTVNRHDMTSGATSELVRANTTGVAGTTTLELVIAGGAVLGPGQAINMSVTVGDGTCFKGAEVHYLRSAATSTLRMADRAPVPGYTPAGEPDADR
jgi:hypothetical protein